MKKIVLLSRVSTEKQDLSQMEQALINAAHSLGYADEQIIKVSRKESGVKLSVAERQSIQELYALIDNDPDIECVMAYELSRIGRRGDVLYEVRGYLQQHKVQLRILNPECVVFNSDWSINTNANLIFGLFVSMAENEAMLMKERMKRGKEKSAEMNKFSGGKVPYGYVLDSNGFFVIDEEKSEIIKKIFSLRIEQKMTIAKIKEYLGSLGHNISWSTVKTILSNEHYTGIKMVGKGTSKYERQYPQIISTETFKLAQTSGQEISSSRERKGVHQWLGKGFLRCAECGCLLGITAVKTRKFFSCRSNQRSKHQIKKCGNTISINAQLVEDLIWEVVKHYYQIKIIFNRDKTIDALGKEKSTLSVQIINIEERIQTIKNRLSKAIEMWLMNDKSEEELEALTGKIKGEIRDLENKVKTYNERLQQVERQLVSLMSDSQSKMDALTEVNNIKDVEKRNEISLSILIKVSVQRYKKTNHKVVKFFFIDGNTQTYFVRGYKKWIGLMEMETDGKVISYDPPIEFRGFKI